MRFDKFVLSTEYVSLKRLKITCYFLVVQYDPLKTSGHRWINLRWRRLNIQSNVSVWVTAQKPLKKLDFKTDRKTATNRYSLCGLLWTRTGFSLGEHSRCMNCISSVSALSSLLPCEWEAMASLWLLSLRVWTKAAVLIINRHTKRRRRKRRRRRWLYSKLHPLLLFGHWRPHVHNCQRLSRPPVGQELTPSLINLIKENEKKNNKTF